MAVLCRGNHPPFKAIQSAQAKTNGGTAAAADAAGTAGPDPSLSNIADDDSNMCLFHPVEGKGLIFGTKQGNIKWLRFC